MRDERGNLRHGRRRNRGARDSGAGGGAANCARADTRCASSERGAGIEAKLVPAAEFPDRLDRDRRIESRRVAAHARDAGANLPWSVWQAARMLDRARPAAVFSMGGYVAGPVLLAALWKRLPVVVMEPNAMPGFTHRQAGAVRLARAGEFRRNGAMVSERTHRSDRAAGARGIFRHCRRKPRRKCSDGADHGRQPGLAHAESRGGGELAAVEARTRFA